MDEKTIFRFWIVHVRIAADGEALRLPIACGCGHADCSGARDYRDFIEAQGLHATIEDRGSTADPGGTELGQTENKKRFTLFMWRAYERQRAERQLGQAIKSMVEQSPAPIPKPTTH